MDDRHDKRRKNKKRMGLSIYLTEDNEDVFNANITHNLSRMADEAGVYEALWRPYSLKSDYNNPENDHQAELEYESKSVTYAREIIDVVRKGLHDLVERPSYYKEFDSSNGWGTYEHFVSFVSAYLEALENYPDAVIEVFR